jgi:hypothetical protein
MGAFPIDKSLFAVKCWCDPAIHGIRNFWTPRQGGYLEPTAINFAYVALGKYRFSSL